MCEIHESSSSVPNFELSHLIFSNPQLPAPTPSLLLIHPSFFFSRQTTSFSMVDLQFTLTSTTSQTTDSQDPGHCSLPVSWSREGVPHRWWRVSALSALSYSELMWSHKLRRHSCCTSKVRDISSAFLTTPIGHRHISACLCHAAAEIRADLSQMSQGPV